MARGCRRIRSDPRTLKWPKDVREYGETEELKWPEEARLPGDVR